MAREADGAGDHGEVLVAGREPLERRAQAQVGAVLVQRVAGLAPERAREMERRDVDGAAELLEREVLGEAALSSALASSTIAGGRRRRRGGRSSVAEGAGHGGVPEPQQQLLDGQAVGAVAGASRAIARAVR